MTSKTKTTTKKTSKVTTKKVALEAVAATAPLEVIPNQTDNDFKNAVLIVSLAVNAFVLIAWVTLKVTSQFDYQVANFLFYR